jgi:hypothetical protein
MFKEFGSFRVMYASPIFSVSAASRHHGRSCLSAQSMSCGWKRHSKR